MPELPQVFLGYPSSPHLRREACATAAMVLNGTSGVEVTTWESLNVSGRFIIDVILGKIDSCDVAAFDVTTLNQNVMFELGYSIGSQKHIWLLRDDTDIPNARLWNQVKVLTTVGYDRFTNSEHIVAGFWTSRPDLVEQTIYDSAIKDALLPATGPGVFYVRSPHETEAGRRLTGRIYDEQSNQIRCVVADASETSIESLSWYAQQIYSADAIIAHFCSPTRQGADVHNARTALVSGLARGMGKHVLMLAESDYLTPIDYRDLLHVYATSDDCWNHADQWLRGILAPAYARVVDGERRRTAIKLSVELKSLRLGEPVAENEANELANYFVETASYD